MFKTNCHKPSRLLRFVAVAMLVSMASSARQLHGASNDFVTASGGKLLLKGKPFYFAGTNAFYLADMGQMGTNDRIDEALEGHAARGATVLRVWAFINGFSVSADAPTPYPMMPTVGTYNETARQALDHVIAKAGSLGIKLIMVLSNYEDFYGGITWWVQEVLGSGKDVNSFYFDNKVKSAFKKFVSDTINRVNVNNNLKYKDDPAILAWEPMNEPKAYGTNYETNKGLTPGSIVSEWLDDISSYIKSLDSNHLVTTGEEGFTCTGQYADNLSSSLQWIVDGSKGSDFGTNIALENIDFAVIHIYPAQWGFDVSDLSLFNKVFIQDRAKIAADKGKPIVLEEYGLQSSQGDREEYFRKVHNMANAAGYMGTLVWQAYTESVDDRKMPFSRYVEIGRVCLVNYGPDYGKLVVIVDVVDKNRALIDTPDMVRRIENFKRLSLTDFKVDIPRIPKKKVLAQALNESGVFEKFAASSWGKKLAKQQEKATLTDFERFKAMLAKKQKSRLVKTAMKKLEA